MLTLPIAPPQLPDRAIADQAKAALVPKSNGAHQHSCPFCAYNLLCHVRSGNLYWRCSHCHELIPID